MSRAFVLAGIGTLVVTAVILSVMGRIPWCECGLGLGTFSAWSSSTSQHLLDPYSTSHLLHGILFYLILWRLFPRVPLGVRMLLALDLEAGWEILENSPLIIERYRAATAALDYTGDSVLNSMGDMLSCWAGFVLAQKWPWRRTLTLAVVIELLMLAIYRDNLTLNVLMLLWPVEGIKQWQMLA